MNSVVTIKDLEYAQEWDDITAPGFGHATGASLTATRLTLSVELSYVIRDAAFVRVLWNREKDCLALVPDPAANGLKITRNNRTASVSATTIRRRVGLPRKGHVTGLRAERSGDRVLVYLEKARKALGSAEVDL